MAIDETGPDRLPERRMDRLFLRSGNEVYRGDRSHVSKTGQRSQASCVALGRRLIFAAIRSATLAVNPFARIRSISHCQAARPSRRRSALFRQRGDKLNDEKRIACGLLEQQFGERPHMLWFRSQRVGDEPSDISGARGLSTISWTLAPASRIRSSVRMSAWEGSTRWPDRRRPAGRVAPPVRRPGAQGVRGWLHPAIANRRGTAREDALAGRTPRGSAGTPSGIDSAPVGAEDPGSGLLADNGGELGNQSDHELAIGTERLEQSLAPTV